MTVVNLLPGGPDRALGADRDAPERPVAGVLVLGAMALAIVAVALTLLATRGIDSRTAQLADLTQQVATTQAEAGQLQRFADFVALADKRDATVRKLAKSRFPFERAMHDVATVLPSGAHLSDLNASTASSGTGNNPLRGAVAAPALELGGCTSSQASIPRLMSRLGDVRGATRVSLASSEAVTTADQAAQGTDVLCAGSKAVTFEIVVFFGDWAGALPTEAVTAGAATSPTPAASPTPAPTTAGAGA